MPKLITNKAQMQCTLGAKPTGIEVTSQTFSQIDGELVATEVDKIGMVNIPSFGTCKCVWYNPPCVPNPTQWSNATVQKTINGMEKLTQDSFCMCTKGGRISFIDTGKNTFVDSE